jgi:hypothetical protein
VAWAKRVAEGNLGRSMLISLALQWRLAAREEVAKQSTQPKNLTPLVEMPERGRANSARDGSLYKIRHEDHAAERRLISAL